MDWYAWLSKAGLAPAETYEYALLFGENELEPADAPDFDHDLLKSMGVAVAKHRLQILKLAKKDAAAGGGNGRCPSSSSVTVVPRICSGGHGDVVVRAGAVRQRRKGVKKMVLMITDSGVVGAGGFNTRSARVPFSSGSLQKASLMFHDCAYEEEEEDDDDDGAGTGTGSEEEQTSDDATGQGGEIKWDSMFQDLKPT